ncbi:trypsin-like, partial [Plectropomus leopardus]|uniref:trypsin-like n=1 Tax=Plectropomus leopardus TaxID=160734 RepID=UPI001C4B1774
SGSEIVHGGKAKENSLLYMVPLQNRSGQHFCGEFLIRKDIVVSAAHCAEGFSVTHAVLGTHNLSKPGLRLNIAKKHLNPTYRGIEHGSDIMVLQLAGNARLDNTIQTIPLPRSAMNIKECQVAGWGLTESGNPVANLRFVDVSIIMPQLCKDKWPGLPANVICAGGYDTMKGFCQGDSGGPLVCSGVAVGVVSFNKNKNCHYPHVPNVYTDIKKYLPWINSILSASE